MTGQVRTSIGEPRTLDIFVMEVDMSAGGKASCSACSATAARVAEAAERVRPVFDALGTELTVLPLLMRDEAQARALGLRSSPMIRIGGIDLHPEHRDRAPDASGWFDTDRVWWWNGEAHDQPPLAMLIDAVLRAYAQGAPTDPGAGSVQVPAYVRQFLQGAERTQAIPACD